MFLRQITDSALAQNAYLIGCQRTGEAIIIDPERDIDPEEAELCHAPQFGSAKDPVNFTGMIAANHPRGDDPVIHWLSPQPADYDLLDARPG
ncbi:MAG: hypothetical protein EOP86_02655 [Verrucomicrobiaceae bacterium]|nr:MAG: hypothetical protein EOP86_02655 [Verrucomicrobiaceae bacterium]